MIYETLLSPAWELSFKSAILWSFIGLWEIPLEAVHLAAPCAWHIEHRHVIKTIGHSCKLKATRKFSTLPPRFLTYKSFVVARGHMVSGRYLYTEALSSKQCACTVLPA